ncbi:MAG: hypothetical protein ABT00_08390 [Bordetella sp. SCN 68-11]|nr:MAG: hypothetical protein ABT00_08390 [Bordetella sp. SCN 68-11]
MAVQADQRITGILRYLAFERRFDQLLRFQFGAHDAGLDHLDRVQALADHVLHVQVDIGIDRARDGDHGTGHQLQLDQAPHRRLLRRELPNRRPAVHAVGQLHILVDEHPVPGHQHVVEHQQGIGLLEAAGQRMLVVILDQSLLERRPGDLAQARRRQRQRERDRVAFVARLEHGQAVDQHLVGDRPHGRQHAGAPHDQAFVGFADHAQVEVGLGLLVRGLGPVVLRCDERVRQEQVVVAHVLDVAHEVVLVPRAGLAEIVPAVEERGQHGVHEIGRAAQQPESLFGHGFEGRPPDPQVLLGLGHEKGRGAGLPAGIRGRGQNLGVLRIRLQVVQPGDLPGGTAEGRMPRHILDALPLDPDLPRMRLQMVQVFRSAAHTHRRSP